MLFDFANVLVFTALGLGFVGVNLLIGKLLRPSNPQIRKLSTYECGEPALGSAWVNFNIRFYIVALILSYLKSKSPLSFLLRRCSATGLKTGKGCLHLSKSLFSLEFFFSA